MNKPMGNATNQEAKVDQQAQNNAQQVSSEHPETNEAVSETVTATQVDPKQAKHGVNYCCGSCGG